MVILKFKGSSLDGFTVKVDVKPTDSKSYASHLAVRQLLSILDQLNFSHLASHVRRSNFGVTGSWDDFNDSKEYTIEELTST